MPARAQAAALTGLGFNREFIHRALPCAFDFALRGHLTELKN
jgi:hypothetical protein